MNKFYSFTVILAHERCKDLYSKIWPTQWSNCCLNFHLLVGGIKCLQCNMILITGICADTKYMNVYCIHMHAHKKKSEKRPKKSLMQSKKKTMWHLSYCRNITPPQKRKIFHRSIYSTNLLLIFTSCVCHDIFFQLDFF